MPGKKRNYAEEYQRRIRRGLSKGLTRSQARGHRRANEAAVKPARPSQPIADERLQLGLRVLRKEKSLKKAAREAHISTERLKRYALERDVLEKQGRRWAVRHDLPRQVLIYSGGREHTITVGDFDAASLVGKYMSAVGHFLKTNNPKVLNPFVGQSATDITGKSHLLETGPNELYRLSQAGGSSIEQVYRVVV